MKFFMEMDPPTSTAQMKQVRIVNNKPLFYDPPSIKKAKEQLLIGLMPFRPHERIDGPIALRTVWLFPKGKSHKNGEWRVTKPDTDNLQKMLKDCMTKSGFWKDDAQVVCEEVEKIWSDAPCGILIEIERLPEVAYVQK